MFVKDSGEYLIVDSIITGIGDFPMHAEQQINSTKIESFGVDIDGVRKFDHLSFSAAVTAAMEFRQKLPDSDIHVCNASEYGQHQNNR